MRHHLNVLLCAILLFSLTACGIFRQFRSYTEPTEGPRARIRVFAGAQTRIYPGDDCFNIDNASYGVVGRGFNFYASNRLLGIPMKPERGTFDEYYLPAGVPVAISYYLHFENPPTLQNSYAEVIQCGPIGFTFTPGQDENYETEFTYDSIRNYCTYSLRRIMQDTDGSYKKEHITPTRATWCPK